MDNLKEQLNTVQKQVDILVSQIPCDRGCKRGVHGEFLLAPNCRTHELIGKGEGA